MWVCLHISLGPSGCLNNAATSTKLKDKVDRSPMNTFMSIPQNANFWLFLWSSIASILNAWPFKFCHLIWRFGAMHYYLYFIVSFGKMTTSIIKIFGINVFMFLLSVAEYAFYLKHCNIFCVSNVIKDTLMSVLA